MLSELMREVLLVALSSEYYLDKEEYSFRTFRALMNKGFLSGEEEVEITEEGIHALGIRRETKGIRPKTIIKKKPKALYGAEPLLLSAKSLPSIAADEGHNRNHTAWYDFSEVVFAMESYGDLEEECIVQIACDYANKGGHQIYTEKIRDVIVFYQEQ